MVDISDDAKIVRRHAEVTGVVRRQRWSDEEKGRIVAEAIAPAAVIADVARRRDLAPQHLSNWIRALFRRSGRHGSSVRRRRIIEEISDGKLTAMIGAADKSFLGRPGVAARGASPAERRGN